MAEATEKWTIKVRSPKRASCEIEAEPDMSVFDVKNIINLSHYDDIAVSNMRAVFKGKILDNDSTLASVGMKSGVTLIIVNMPSKKSADTKPTAEASAAGTTSPEDAEVSPVAEMLKGLIGVIG